MLTAAGRGPCRRPGASAILLCGRVCHQGCCTGTWSAGADRHRRASGREIWRRARWRTRPLRRQTAQCPAADQARDGQNVRNVVLVGHTGAGKTTLVEALLVATGTIHRAGRVEDGTTVSDHDEAELRQQRSVSLVPGARCTIEGVKVNLLDTPGYADFVGDLRAGPAGGRLRAVRRLDRRADRRLDPDAVGGVRGGRDAARRRAHQARPRPLRLRGHPRRLPARRSATTCCRSTCRSLTPTARPPALVGHAQRPAVRLLAAAPARSPTRRRTMPTGWRPRAES